MAPRKHPHDPEPQAYHDSVWEQQFNSEMASLRTPEDDGPLLDIDPDDPDVQAWYDGE